MDQRKTKVEKQLARLTVEMAALKANSVTRHHVDCLETEMRQLISELKDEMYNSTYGLRTELRTSISGIKDEMQTSTFTLKDEMQTSAFTLKTELHYLLLNQTRWFCSVLLLALFAGLWCAKLIF